MVTDGGAATTKVVQVQISVTTATAASDGVEVGDVTVLLADTVQDQLDKLINDAATACAGAAARLRKRAGMVTTEYRATRSDFFQGAACSTGCRVLRKMTRLWP